MEINIEHFPSTFTAWNHPIIENNDKYFVDSLRPTAGFQPGVVGLTQFLNFCSNHIAVAVVGAQPCLKILRSLGTVSA